jgi:hypothetical protein
MLAIATHPGYAPGQGGANVTEKQDSQCAVLDCGADSRRAEHAGIGVVPDPQAPLGGHWPIGTGIGDSGARGPMYLPWPLDSAARPRTYGQVRVDGSLGQARIDWAAIWTLGSLYVRGTGAQLDAAPAHNAMPAIPTEGSGRVTTYGVCALPWPCDEALAVLRGPTAACPTGESGGDWSAENGSNIGGFQINIAAHPYTREQMLDPVQNIQAAYALWRDQGWAPWACRP